MRARLTYSNVVSTLCLFIVLGGAAYGAAKLGKNSVSSKQIKNGSIEVKDISDDAQKSLSGQDGAQGPAGATGPAGSTVVARVRSTGAVTTPDTGSVSVPLTGNTWTQTSDEVDQLGLTGSVTWTAPAGSPCGGGPYSLVTELDIDGQLVATGTPGILPNMTHTSGLGTVGTLPEPGSDTPRTATVLISDTCSDPAFEVQIDAVRFDVIGTR